MSLTSDFLELLQQQQENPASAGKAAELVISAPESGESNGLMALIYHDGIGIARNLEKSLQLAEKAAFEAHDALGYYILALMCDRKELPDEADGSPNRKYDLFDAVCMFRKCIDAGGPWTEKARLHLGDFFMDMDRGGYPEEGLEHYAAIANTNAEAAGKLSDYYWNIIAEGDEVNNELRSKEIDRLVFRWTSAAVRLNPHDYSYRMGLCYALGIDCDPQAGARLARKYWEDAYDFGAWWAADSIAELFKRDLDELSDTPENADRRNNLMKQIASWRKLARREQERRKAKEAGNSLSAGD